MNRAIEITIVAREAVVKAMVPLMLESVLVFVPVFGTVTSAFLSSGNVTLDNVVLSSS